MYCSYAAKKHFSSVNCKNTEGKKVMGFSGGNVANWKQYKQELSQKIFKNKMNLRGDPELNTKSESAW